MVELNLVYSRRNCIEAQFIPFLVLVARRNTVPISHIGCYVIHQLQDPAGSNIRIIKLDHLIPQILIILERQLQTVITMSRTRAILNRL